MGRHTMVSDASTGKEGKEKNQKGKIKKIVQPDDSFVARQTSARSRVTCHSWGPSLPLPLNAHWGWRYPRYPETHWLASETHWKSPVLVAEGMLPFDTCNHMCSCKQHECPNSYDCNLLEVQSCELNTKSDAGFSEPLLDGGKPTLLVTDSTMENVKFSSESQLGHLRGTAHKKDVWVFSS